MGHRRLRAANLHRAQKYTKKSVSLSEMLNPSASPKSKLLDIEGMLREKAEGRQSFTGQL